MNDEILHKFIELKLVSLLKLKNEQQRHLVRLSPSERQLVVNCDDEDLFQFHR